MSEIKGAKIVLQLVRSQRYQVHYHIVLLNEAIGEVELDHIAWRSGEAELKISITNEEFRNRGYGTDAIMTILSHAFEKMNLKRVYLRVHGTNAQALTCYSKAGFKKEGRLQRLTPQGEKEEIFLMAIKRSQFLKQSKGESCAV
ncbi:MAG: GNAT family protein [Bacillota bacterium]|nr:GNAT family protein [Bacillota bacterium]HHU61698.1 GNAT family N-acetyltransferase [Natronincola sp.]